MSPLEDRWYHWAGVSVGTSYAIADRMVSEAVSQLEFERDELRSAVQEIVRVARAGAWEGPEIPAPVAAAIAHADMVLRRAQQRFKGKS